mmetsp:Transcript_28870/g.83773  ORF Transcript_28870/g.83773 Transcript_28870/m.83773 type:complete len:83 (-) Transcript_28870:280-528(-)
MRYFVIGSANALLCSGRINPIPKANTPKAPSMGTNAETRPLMILMIPPPRCLGESDEDDDDGTGTTQPTIPPIANPTKRPIR